MSLPFPAITSRRHPLVQACRDARAGGPGQPLLLDGWHLVQEALAAHLDVDAVGVGAEPPGPSERAALDTLADAGAQVVRVTADVLQAMSPVRTPSGVVALARRPAHAIDAVFAPPPALVVAAVDVQDPGNVGALVRTAEALGASGLLAVGTTADPFAWKALRAAMGSAFRLPIVRVASAAEAMAAARDRGVQAIALVPRGGASPAQVDLARPTCLLVGGEGPGLPPALVRDADRTVSLPMAATVESLNVAVAGALALYEAAGHRARAR
ncbi:MAG: TrmH family RNA methyltransferase [Vicinamibacterales bacterium]